MSDHFKNKASAFAWYKEQGGTREKTSFYENNRTDKGRVFVDHVIELLRVEGVFESERTERNDFLSMKLEGNARKAIAAAEREEIRLEAERRELEKKWVFREDAEQDVCIWTALTRDFIAARLEKATMRIIESVGGDVDRVPELQEVIDEAITDGCNDVADLGEVHVEILG